MRVTFTEITEKISSMISTNCSRQDRDGLESTSLELTGPEKVSGIKKRYGKPIFDYIPVNRILMSFVFKKWTLHSSPFSNGLRPVFNFILLEMISLYELSRLNQDLVHSLLVRRYVRLK